MVKWLVAIATGGVIMYLIGKDPSPFQHNGKFLGVFEETPGLDLADAAKAAVVIGGAAVLGMAAHKLSGGALPQGVKV